MTILPEPAVLAAFVAASLILIITPGPDMTLFLSQTINGGRGRGFASMQGVMAAKRTLSGGVQTIDDLMEKAIFLCGSPSTLREKLEQYQAQIGFGYLLPTMQFGTLPHELVTKSTTLFANEVIPHFRGKADRTPVRAGAA